ncbi:MAG TPA: hypothetical protein GYA07_15775 [Verrucomicrobia bacterium]|nr:hypothetical protein [Verrucomicrobiota bacterium]HOB32805.1 hypothetical protein [Verrucomicrobiota bacterium]HOP98663.1 hypothetical protein [Verrucomicrobiota bacterium]HPU56406.1 hypothetical protein [Verrucomicrobiota bacterium]
MKRGSVALACVIAGLLAVVAGVLVPAHLRAVDARLLERAGKGAPDLVDCGLELVARKEVASAELLLEAARAEAHPAVAILGQALDDAARTDPPGRFWGASRPAVAHLLDPQRQGGDSLTLGVTELVLRFENRAKVLDLLMSSSNPAVQEIMRFRALTNTALFPPSVSSAGQALDAALSLCGLLLSERVLSPGLSNEICSMVIEANKGGNPQPFEEVLMDFLSLGQRFNWGQLAGLVSGVPDVDTLHQVSGLVRKAGREVPIVFAAVQLSGDVAGVAHYLSHHSQSGLSDLGRALVYGEGGLRELLKRNQRVYDSPLAAAWLQDWSLRRPGVALSVKWFLYLAGGFLLAAALHWARRVPAMEAPLQVRGIHVARETLFALGFLLVVLLLSEPFLAEQSQRADFRLQLRLPTVGGAATAGSTSLKASFMNKSSLLTLLLFFVIQGLIYVACLVKLAEIRRQRVGARIKLKLLENEDHLFDAGLYLGFAGTIISLILVSLGVIQQSLMAAYSSTSFGIIFVSVFKIFHLRPARRKLLLEAEGAAARVAAAPSSTMAAPL